MIRSILSIVGLVGLAYAQSLAPGPDSDQVAFAPLPPTATGPQIDPNIGYYVQHLGHGAYVITEGVYQSLFLVSDKGVILVDAPPTIGKLLPYAIGNITSLPVKKFIYSHAHADHNGGAYLFNKTAEYIAHEDTLAALKKSGNDSLRPRPTKTFKQSYKVTLGNQTLELDYKGPNHCAGNIFAYGPAAKVLMVVDILAPGWAPFAELVKSQDIPGWLAAHDQILSYDFDYYVGGHLSRIGNQTDVYIQKQYVDDLFANCKASINGGFDVNAALGPVNAASPGNSWAQFKAYFRAASRDCAEKTSEKWISRLGGVDATAWENAYAAVGSLRNDFDVLGPFTNF